MTTIRARLCSTTVRLLLGLLIATCVIVPSIDAVASAAIPDAHTSRARAHARASRARAHARASRARARDASLEAPRLVALGHKLMWSRVGRVRDYILASQPAGQASSYRLLTKIAATPKPVPGTTVEYRVKTDVSGSAWTPPVAISYPARGKGQGSSPPGSAGGGSGSSGSGAGAGTEGGSGAESGSGSEGGSSKEGGSGSGSGTEGGSGSGTGSGTEGGSGSEGLGGSVEEPELASKRAKSLKVGLIGFRGWGTGPSETIRKATGVKYTRASPVEEGWAPARELVSEGITPLVLYDPHMAGMSPATVAENLKSYIPIMHELGLTEIELGNEVYYNGSAPAEYALQYRAAHEALAGSGITLIADAWIDAQKPNGEWSDWEAHGGWCVLFVDALGYVPDAWSFHPYGPMNADHFGSGANRQGWETVPRMIAYMKEDHIYAPLNITEVGQPTFQGTDGNTAVSDAEQAADVKQYLTQASEWGLASIYLYEAVDTGEGGYGLYSWPLKAKPSAAVFAETLAKLSAA
jgi:hypothetical protein